MIINLTRFKYFCQYIWSMWFITYNIKTKNTKKKIDENIKSNFFGIINKLSNSYSILKYIISSLNRTSFTNY